MFSTTTEQVSLGTACVWNSCYSVPDVGSVCKVSDLFMDTFTGNTSTLNERFSDCKIFLTAFDFNMSIKD